MAHELAGRGVVVQINTEESPRLADRFAIKSIPTVLCVRGGKVIDRVGGAMSRNTLLAWWKSHAV